MDGRSPFLEALRGHESLMEFEGRSLQRWDNLLGVPGRKGLLMSPSGHCCWGFVVPNWEMFPVCGVDGVQMFGLSQQKRGKVKSQEKHVSSLGGSRLTPLRGRTARGLFQGRDWKLGEKMVRK